MGDENMHQFFVWQFYWFFSFLTDRLEEICWLNEDGIGKL